jgi:DNA polymerase-3 subunit epsilon
LPRHRQVRQQPAAYQTTLADPPSGAPAGIDVQRLLVRADFIRPLSGKCVVFAGKLQKLSYEEAQRLTCRAGGDCQQTVSHETNYVVVGSGQKVIDGPVDPTEQERCKADELRRAGLPIEILSEEEFIGLVISN